MAKVNSKDKDAQTILEPIEVCQTNSDEQSRAVQRLVRKGRHLDVDETLARSFKDVKSISPALNKSGLEQGKAT